MFSHKGAFSSGKRHNNLMQLTIDYPVLTEEKRVIGHTKSFDYFR